MSSTPVAYLILGFKVDDDSTHYHSQERGCAHSVSAAKFCAECGKSMWNAVRTCKELPELTMYTLRNERMPVGFLRVRSSEDDEGFIGVLFAASDPHSENTVVRDLDRLEQARPAIAAFCHLHHIVYDDAAVALHLVHTWN